MPPDTIYISLTGFNPGDEADIVQAWKELSPTVEAGHTLCCSADEVERCLTVIASNLTWKVVLGIAGTAYLTGASTEAGKTTWAAIRAGSKLAGHAVSSAIPKLKNVFRSLIASSGRVDRRIGLALRFTSPEGGATFIPNMSNEEEFERDCLIFVISQDSVRVALTRLPENDRRGDFKTLTINDNGFTLSWMRTSANRCFQQDFDPLGNPLSEPRRCHP